MYTLANPKLVLGVGQIDLQAHTMYLNDIPFILLLCTKCSLNLILFAFITTGKHCVCWGRDKYNG